MSNISTNVTVAYEEDGALAIVTLNRPSVNNCFDNDTVLQLADIWSTLAANATLRCAIFTGNGRAFSAGVDLSR